MSMAKLFDCFDKIQIILKSKEKCSESLCICIEYVICFHYSWIYSLLRGNQVILYVNGFVAAAYFLAVFKSHRFVNCLIFSLSCVLFSLDQKKYYYSIAEFHEEKTFVMKRRNKWKMRIKKKEKKGKLRIIIQFTCFIGAHAWTRCSTHYSN